MARYQAITELLLQWSEKGGDLPAKVKRELDQLSQGGNQTTSVMGKLGSAFDRLERREPMLAMRALRGAVDDLAVSAIGASGPAGRLVASFATLGGGGLQSLLVLGGVGASLGGLKLAVSELLNPVITATDNLDKFTTGLKKAKDAGEQLRDLQTQLAAAAPRAGLLAGLFQNAPGFLGGIGAGAGEALDRAATASQAARDALAASRHEAATDAVQDLNIQTAALGQNADMVARLVGWQKQWSEADIEAFAHASQKHANAVQALADEKALEQARERALKQFLLERMEIQAQLRNPFLPPVTLLHPIQQADALETLDQLMSRADHWLGTLGQHPEWAAGLQGMSLQDIGNAGAGAPGGDQTMAVLSALIGLAGSARGGPGGVLSGLGGLASVSFRTTPILGQVLSFGGGLLSLFSSGQAKVSISRLEEQAIQDMKRAIQVPQNVSVNVVNAGDIRNTKQALARAEGLDTVSRLPG